MSGIAAKRSSMSIATQQRKHCQAPPHSTKQKQRDSERETDLDCADAIHLRSGRADVSAAASSQENESKEWVTESKEWVTESKEW
eukprot:42743-Rhodomonas_salina.1